MNKKTLSERDICSKFITPAIQAAGWDLQTQVREELTFTAGRVIVRGRLHSRGEKRRADYVLFHQKNQPIAVIEAKDNNHSVGSGMQQALAYAEALDVLFVFSSNGDLERYLATYFDSVLFKKQIFVSKSGAVIQQIPASKISELIIPLPPINAVKRIIEINRKLLETCDGLAERLKDSVQTQAVISDVLVEKVVS
jgi:predicted type IV restriction endonuclease